MRSLFLAVVFVHLVLSDRPIEQADDEKLYKSDNEVPIDDNDVALYSAERKFILAKTEEDKEKYAREIYYLAKGHKLIDDAFENIVSIVAPDARLYATIIIIYDSFDTRIMPCYKKLVAELKTHCFNYSENFYVFNHFYKLANMCSSGSIKEETVVNAFKSVCTDTHRNIKGIS